MSCRETELETFQSQSDLIGHTVMPSHLFIYIFILICLFPFQSALNRGLHLS